ncbi:hypothetical protein [Deinococcus sp. Leaf326]|uniref:hypothetical protein n=1 Tax=Deinococcus sp. Leaf326 TaxID=1736338 RepID=UPI0006FB330A|nr:hypothetical protein [Deinococcus sp. Leaf326]KQR35977.1 hypothetical protein ASF71_15625 [Deinococcus sp. Leaf326]
MQTLGAKEFKEIDCDTFCGEGISKTGARCFVSVLKREEVVARLAATVKPFAGSGPWAEDYGQYHRSFRLSAAAEYTFGFGVSRVAYNGESFGGYPGIWGRYESNIV